MLKVLVRNTDAQTSSSGLVLGLRGGWRCTNHHQEPTTFYTAINGGTGETRRWVSGYTVRSFGLACRPA
eukprot:9500538-Pyramimonas_sp.AAC.1